MRRGDSEPREDSRNDNVTYPIPSAMTRDRGIKHQDDMRPGMYPHDDRRGRRGSPLRDHRRGRGYRDRYRDDRPRHERREDRERMGSRRARCRDYDEKGFCMRGELCPFDHGNDPVVVQDVLPPGMLGFPASTAPTFLPDGQPIPGTTLPGGAGPLPGSYPPPNSQPPPPGTSGTLPNEVPKSQANQEGPDTTIPASGPQPSAPVGMVPQRSQAPVMSPHPVRMIRQPMIRGQAPRPPFRNPFEDSYNPEQPQFDRTPVWMRLGNGRPPHPIPPRGVFPPPMGLRSRELLAVSPNPAQLTVQVPGIAAPHPTVPTMPDRIVIHSDPKTTTPVPPQEQPRPQQQPPAAPQQGPVQAVGSVNHTVPVKSRVGFPKKFSDTLELKKIPRDLNNIAKLNEHFQRFGTITNIKVCAFGDPEAALVQFSHHSEAKAAYSCPDAVLANRFIRVFWHNPDRQQENKDGNSNQGVTTGSSNSRSTPAESAVKDDSNKATAEPKAKPTMFQSGKTTFSKTAKALPAHVPASPAMTKRQQELQKQEAIKKKLEIQKQKQELLNKQIKEQKLLISKLEKKNLSAAEKDLIMKTIKSLSSNIESLKKEVELAAMAAKSKESPSQARQIAQKAILDQELDLITHQNTGEDTTELKKKVEELKQEAKSLGLLDPPSRGRGRGAVRGRGRGTPTRSRPLPRTTRVWTRDSASLDHRPRQITVGEITPEQKEDVAEHFKEFGIVDTEEYIEDKNVLNLTFRTRKEAEIAYNKGKTFKGRALKVSWYRAPAPPISPAGPTTPTTPTVLKKVEEELGLDIDAELGKHEFDAEADEALLLGEDFDEEEEEEDERSWKR